MSALGSFARFQIEAVSVVVVLAGSVKLTVDLAEAHWLHHAARGAPGSAAKLSWPARRRELQGVSSHPVLVAQVTFIKVFLVLQLGISWPLSLFG